MFKSDREYLRRYGKFLVAEQEECEAGGYLRPYTPLRYVSQEEINQMVSAFPNCIRVWSWESFNTKFDDLFGPILEKKHGKKSQKPFKYPKLVTIPIMRKNTPDGRCGETVDGPGYYRVEINKRPAPYFLTACADGIPINTGMGRLSHWEETFNREWRERYHNWKWEKERRDAKAKEMEERRRRLLRIPEKRESRQFFQAVAMASAVGA